MKLLTTLLLATATALPPAAAAGDSLTVIVSGRGTPVVFIPGLLGSEYGFRNVIAALDPTRYQSIVIEPLGFGSSLRPQDADYSLTAQAERIAAALDTLVDGPVWLVAHSVSASIAYRIAYRHPDRVQGILSIEGGPTETLATRGFRTAMRFAPVIRMMGPRPMVKMIRGQLERASADKAWITDEVIAEYTAGFREDFGASLKALQTMSKTEEPERLTDHLSEIGCPVILLIGDTEHQSRPPEDEVALLAERIPNISVDSVVGVGHFIHEEDPEAVLTALERLTRTEIARVEREQ